MSANDSGPLLTAQQVARKVALSLRSVRRIIDAELLPVVRIGRAVRIQATDLDAFIRKHTVGRSQNSADS